MNFLIFQNVSGCTTDRKSNLISTEPVKIIIELAEVCHYEFPFFWKRSNP